MEQTKTPVEPSLEPKENFAMGKQEKFSVDKMVSIPGNEKVKSKSSSHAKSFTYNSVDFSETPSFASAIGRKCNTIILLK